MCFKKLKSFFRRKNGEDSVQVESNDQRDNNDHSVDVIVTNEKNGTDNSTDDPGTERKINFKEPLMNKNNSLPEFEYLEKLILFRLNRYFSGNNNDDSDKKPPFPEISKWGLPWQDFAKKNNLENKEDELTLLLIGMAPHLKPDFFDHVIEKKIQEYTVEKKIEGNVDFPGIGGARGKNCRFFLPTGETALFIIAGNDFDRRLQAKQLFGAEHIFWDKKIIWLEDMQHGEPSMHGRLIISPDYVDLLTYGMHTSPQFSISFPAKKIAPEKKQNGQKVTETDVKKENKYMEKEWGDTQKNDNDDQGKENPYSFDKLVIPDDLKKQILDLESWLKYRDQLEERFDNLRKGYRTLFYGPPGTGKTFTAKILGNQLNKEVYKIDLSMVVSKYIGETEKNLELLFARAEDKDWILFFDEADALFGKRTNVRDAHDKYANQEVSYLLQRIEDYDGLVILATNMKNNIDDAFLRRFNSVLKFPFPDVESRARIWQLFLPTGKKNKKKIVYKRQPDERTISYYDDDSLDIAAEVKKYELSGGSIMNVVHYAGIKAVERYAQAVESKKTAKAQGAGVMENGSASLAEDDFRGPRPKFTIYLSDVLDGIKRELIKEGKPFSV